VSPGLSGACPPGLATSTSARLATQSPPPAVARRRTESGEHGEDGLALRRSARGATLATHRRSLLAVMDLDESRVQRRVGGDEKRGGMDLDGSSVPRRAGGDEQGDGIEPELSMVSEGLDYRRFDAGGGDPLVLDAPRGAC